YLHNLLLMDDGYLFHVDFGYNLGRDPKSFPPPMKLRKEMREAVGGAERGSFIGFPVENIRVVIIDGASRAVDLSKLAMSYNIREDLSLIAFLDVLLLEMLSRSIKPSCQAFKVTGIVTSAPGFRRRADFNASYPMEITEFYDEICTSTEIVPALATLIQRS
ncbi:phosphatidylinositol 3-kinase, root isoform, partial [Tanacetum coccineum]